MLRVTQSFLNLTILTSQELPRPRVLVILLEKLAKLTLPPSTKLLPTAQLLLRPLLLSLQSQLPSRLIELLSRAISQEFLKALHVVPLLTMVSSPLVMELMLL